MPHDRRLVADESKIKSLQDTIPDWIRHLARPATPCLAPTFGPLEGIRVVSTGQLIASPYSGTKLAEFGAEVIHVEKPGGDVFRFTAPQLKRGPRVHGADEAEVTKNKLSLGLDFKKARGIELLMALWKISDVWMESSMPGTLERNGISNELALAVNPQLVIVRTSTYGQFGEEEYLSRPGYDAIAQAYGGMMNLTGDPAGPPQRAKCYTGDYVTALTGWAATMMGLWEAKKTGRGQVIDVAQYEAVAQTNGNTLPLYSGEGIVYGHTGNKAPGFQPYDTFKCSDGWVFIGALGGPIYERVPRFLGLDPVEYSYDECSKDAAAVNSPKGRELDQKLRDYCAAHTAEEVEIGAEQGEDRLRPRLQRARPVQRPALCRSRDDRAGPRPPVRRADPRLRRRAQDVADAGTDLAWRALDRRGYERRAVEAARVIGGGDRDALRRWRGAPHRAVHGAASRAG